MTARLSKGFYAALGEDVAKELVDWFNAVDLAYHTEIRELNELNFVRFDARLEHRVAELRAELRQDIAEFKIEIRNEMSGLREEMAGFKGEMCQEMAGFKGEICREISALREEGAVFRGEIGKQLAEWRTELHTSIQNVQDKTLRWMIGLWIVAIGALAGGIVEVLQRLPS